MPADWRDPMRKVKAPRLCVEPIEPASIQDTARMLAVCGDDLAGTRDRAIILTLLDSAARPRIP